MIAHDEKILAHALKALEPNPRARERMARRNAYFFIERFDQREGLEDEIGQEVHRSIGRILDNFLAGDDLQNGKLLASVIYQLGRCIEELHPEEAVR